MQGDTLTLLPQPYTPDFKTCINQIKVTIVLHTNFNFSQYYSQFF